MYFLFLHISHEKKKEKRKKKKATTQIMHIYYLPLSFYLEICRWMANLAPLQYFPYETYIPMTSIQVSQISFESEICGVKWRHFYDKIVNK